MRRFAVQVIPEDELKHCCRIPFLASAATDPTATHLKSGAWVSIENGVYHRLSSSGLKH